MHRATTANVAYRAYTAGGARSVVDNVDDSKLMQESSGNFMKGETRSEVEAPQNYGFTSVTADADQQQQQGSGGGGSGGGAGGGGGGSGPGGGMGAEAFISFPGGNRSFPVAGVIDDRRHRLYNLGKDAAKGSSAQFGLKDWGEQFLITDDGMYMTGNAGQTKGGGQQGGGGSAGATAAGGSGGSSGGQQKDFRIKLQLVENKNNQQQQSGGGGGGGGGGSAGATRISEEVGSLGLPRMFFTSEDSGVEFEYDVVAPLADGDSGSNGGGQQDGQQTQKSKGQKTLHKEKSETYHDMTKEKIEIKRGKATTEQTDKHCMGYHGDKSKSYRADDSHTHIKSGSSIWTSKGGCYSSAPIIVKPCQDSD